MAKSRKSKMIKVDDGMLLLVSSGRRGMTFQDCWAQKATWADPKVQFEWVTRKLRYQGYQKVVLASLI